MKNTQLLVKILHALNDLFHEHLDLPTLVQLHEALLALFLDELGQAHVHLLEHNEKFPIFKLNPLSLHDVGAMTAFFIQLSKSLENLDLSLVKCLFLVLELIFKLLNCIDLARLDVPTPVDMPKRTTSDQVKLFILIPDN